MPKAREGREKKGRRVMRGVGRRALQPRLSIRAGQAPIGKERRNRCLGVWGS